MAAGDPEAERLFAGPGEMRARSRAFDWSATPLGPVAGWPATLRTAVRLMLDAPIATSLWCGPAYTLLYNDTYQRILGVKHPGALGRSGAQVWDELWPALEPQFARVRAGGPAVYEDESLLVMERLEGGRAEDAWFTYALSALTDDAGECLAVYNVAVEVTSRVRARHAMNTERDRLFETFQRVPSFVSVVTGPEHVLEYANEAYYRLVGQRDILGKPVWEALPDARGQGFEELLDHVRDTGEPFVGREAPLALARTPGQPPEQRYVDFVYQALTDADGVRWGVMGYGTDVTEQVVARRELELMNERLQEQATELEAQTEELQETVAELEERTEEAEEARRGSQAARQRLLDTFESITDPFFTVDADWNFTYVNPAAARVTGRDPAALIGKGLWTEFPEAVGTAYYTNAMIAVQERRAIDFEAYYPPPLDFWTAMRIYPLGRAAQPEGIAVYYQDVTARKLAERRLEESEARLRDLFEQAPVAVAVLTGPDHVYTVMSPRYAGFLRGGRENLGRPFREAVPEIAGQGVAELMDRVFQTGEPHFMRERMVHLDRDGDGVMETYWFDIGYQPLRGANGDVYAIASVSQDVTAHVVARRELEQARRLAEEANQAKTDFLATMSHELRTPLNAIAGYADLLEIGIHGPVSDAQREALHRIQRSQRHLLGLINDVLNFAKLEAGHVEFALADVAVCEVVDALEPLVAPQLRAKALRYDRERCRPDADGAGAGTVRVRADEDKLQQILVNLLSNAIKFTPAGGAVTLACREEADVVVITVEDTGIGIPADRLEAIFAPFVQVDRRLNAPHEGTGLGLAISRDLARGMDGDLTARSTPGAGSTFVLTLPKSER